MSNGTDKTVKVSFSVDDASAAKAARLFRDLTQEVNKFIAATRQADAAFGGGGGGVFGAKMSNIPGRAGTSAQTQMGHQVVGAGSGLAKTLAGAVQNSASLFKGAADGSKGAFKIMSDSLRKHVDDSDREIRRLSRSLSSIERQYSRLKGMGGKLHDPAMLGRVQEQFYGTADQLAQARTARAGLVKAEGALGTAGDAAGVNGPMGRLRGFFASKSDAIGKGVTSVANSLGIPTAALGGIGVGVAIAAGVTAGLKVAGAARTSEIANLNYQVDRPMFRLNAQAQAGGVFGGNALALHQGDVARAHAMRILAGDTDYKDITSSKMADRLRVRRNLENPDTLLGKLAQGMGGGMGGTFSGAKDYLGSRIGAGVADLVTGDKNLNSMQIAKERAKVEGQMQQAQMAQAALEAKVASDPMYNERWNSLYSGALGTLGLARGAGLRSGLVRIGKTDKFMDQMEQFEGVANTFGYTGGDRAGARQRMAGSAGRRFMGSGDIGLLNLEAGGLSNAANMRGVGAQFNGGYKSFESALVGRGSGTGRGGVDTTAANQVLGMGMGAMTAGNFTGSGIGFNQTLLDATYTGDASDMRMAREVGAGMGALGNRMSGGVDPLQQALNASAALKAAPNASWATKDALMKMSPAEMMDFMRTGRVPPQMEVMGVTPDMLRKYVGETNRTQFSRVNKKMLAGTAVGAEVDKYLGAGGNLSYLKGKSRKEINAALFRLGKGAMFAGTASNIEQGEGMFRLQASTEKILRGGKGAGAAFNVNMGSAQGVAASQTGLEHGMTGVHLGEEDSIGKRDINSMTELGVSQEVARGDSQRAMAKGDAGLAIRGVAEALNSFVHVLEGLQGTAGTKGGGRRAAGPSAGSH